MAEEQVSTQPAVVDNAGETAGQEGSPSPEVDLMDTPEGQALQRSNPKAYENFRAQWTRKNQEASSRQKAWEDERAQIIKERDEYKESISGYEGILSFLDERAVESGYESIDAWREAYESGTLTQKQETQYEEAVDDSGASNGLITKLTERLDKLEKSTQTREQTENAEQSKQQILSFRKTIKDEFGVDDVDKYADAMLKLLPGLGAVLPPEQALRMAYNAVKFPDLNANASKSQKTLEGIKKGQPPATTQGKVTPGNAKGTNKTYGQSVVNILEAGNAARNSL